MPRPCVHTCRAVLVADAGHQGVALAARGVALHAVRGVPGRAVAGHCGAWAWAEYGDRDWSSDARALRMVRRVSAVR